MSAKLFPFTVLPKKHDFRPVEPMQFLSHRDALRWEFVITADCWYNNLGADQGDYNKLGGITRAMSPNNVDSILWAWRPSKAPGLFEVCIYRNEGSSIAIDHSSQRLVRAGERFTITAYPTGESAYTVTFAEGQTIIEWGRPWFRKRYTLLRRVGLWFGGNRRAPQQMTIMASFENLGKNWSL